MPDYPKPRAGRVVGTLEAPYVPEQAPVTDRSHLLMTRPWLEWCRRITGMAVNGGGGDVVGPGSATADAIALFSGTTGKLIKDSLKTIAQLTTDIINAILPGGKLPVANLSAHHATHEVGGSDTLVNAAWTNQPNSFTAPQTLANAGAATPRLLFTDSANQPVDARVFRISNAGQQLLFRAMSDDDATLQGTPLALERDGDAVIGKDLTVTGSGGNVACKNQANTFTAGQTISLPSGPDLTMNQTSAAADARRWDLQVFNNQLEFAAKADAGGTQAISLRLNRVGDAFVGRHLAVWNDLTVGLTGSMVAGGNVARRDQANTFTQAQTFNAYQRLESAGPNIRLIDTMQPANQKVFAIQNYAGSIYFQAQDDALNYLNNSFQVNRAGDAYVGRDLYEKGRTTPMGHWIDIPYLAGNFAATGSGVNWTVEPGDILTYQYCLIGRTAIYSFMLVTTSISGTTMELRMYLPITATKRVGTICELWPTGGLSEVGHAIIYAGGNYIDIARINGQPFGAVTNNCHISGQIAITI